MKLVKTIIGAIAFICIAAAEFSAIFSIFSNAPDYIILMVLFMAIGAGCIFACAKLDN